MRIAVIPARGGSKRIPRKNIKEFCGQPIIAWSIEAALSSQCFDQVIVSTDDEEIASIAKQYGAVIPFMRPLSLADDHTPTLPVMRHALDWFLQQGIELDHSCCVYATAPFLRSQDILAGLREIEKDECNYVFSMAKFSYPIQRALKINRGGFVEMLQPEHATSRSQDIDEVYHDAGQFYWGRTQAWADGESIFAKNSRAIVLPSQRVHDIDTFDDWSRAECMFRALVKGH
jgi:pseudaminic acid cytidylyltransferase